MNKSEAVATCTPTNMNLVRGRERVVKERVIVDPPKTELSDVQNQDLDLCPRCLWNGVSLLFDPLHHRFAEQEEGWDVVDGGRSDKERRQENLQNLLPERSLASSQQ